MLCVPWVNSAAVQAGTEPLVANTDVQSTPATESETVTVPVGTVRPASEKAVVTEALKLTTWFTPEGLGVIEVMAAVVFVLFTCCDSVVEDAEKFESPAAYVAVTMRAPEAINGAEQVAVVTEPVVTTACALPQRVSVLPFAE
jgi:hypothetical protein